MAPQQEKGVPNFGTMDSLSEFRHRIDSTMNCLMHFVQSQAPESIQKSASLPTLISIGNTFRNLSKPDEVIEFVKHLSSEEVHGVKLNQLQIPFSVLKDEKSAVPNDICDLPSVESIKNELGRGEVSIRVNGMQNIGPLSKEKLRIDSSIVDTDDDAGCSTPHGQKATSGNLLYRQLLQRMSRFIADADLLLSSDQIQEHQDHYILVLFRVRSWVRTGETSGVLSRTEQNLV